MAKFNSFFSENIGLSIVGHLGFVAGIVLMAQVVISEHERFVAPDRIQITEIDLSQIRVSGDESILYNTNVPDTTPEPESKPKPVEVMPKSEPVVTDVKKLETPTLIEEEKKPEKKEQPKEEKPKEEKKVEEIPQAPKKKMRVQVNRNVVSLDRTLSLAVVDALREAMKRCWLIDTKRSDVAGMRVVAHLKMRQNGTVSDLWFESAARADTDAAFAYVLDTVRSAINACQPLRMLPQNEYEKWRDIQLTFYPTKGEVM
ncbi:MAG: hypothetical protein K5912_02370 [Alphaproteobacteria bacterium]|nr:hypothetical protein [Alphaproteobacteria bacterium]